MGGAGEGPLTSGLNLLLGSPSVHSFLSIVIWRYESRGQFYWSADNSGKFIRVGLFLSPLPLSPFDL